jgi:hypothetical protein
VLLECVSWTNRLGTGQIGKSDVTAGLWLAPAPDPKQKCSSSCSVRTITIGKRRREHAISLSPFVSIPLHAFGRVREKLYVSGVPIDA